MARKLAFAVSRGTDFLGRSTRQGEVIYHWKSARRTLKPIFAAIGATGQEPIQIHAANAPEVTMLALVQLVRERKTGPGGD